MTKRDSLWGLALLALLVTVGCGKKEEVVEAPAPAEEPAAVEPAPAMAMATLIPRADSGISGSVTFTETDGGVRVVAEVAGVEPGLHGLHIHEIGDCSSEDFKSAGGHFNPAAVPHGGPSDAERHAGDLGNIEIGADGAGRLELVSELLSIDSGDAAVAGRAVILHEGEDDLVSQPTGAAGGRLACGVVG